LVDDVVSECQNEQEVVQVLISVRFQHFLIGIQPQDWRLALNVWIQEDVIGVNVMLDDVLVNPRDDTASVPILTQA